VFRGIIILTELESLFCAGILAILEEESLFPKASDRTLEEKLKANHLGKSPNFVKAITKADKNAHFAIGETL
jgi:myosin heavy subunit